MAVVVCTQRSKVATKALFSRLGTGIGCAITICQPLCFAVVLNTWVPRAGLLLRLVVVDLKQSSEGAFANEDSNPPFRFTRYQAGVQFVSGVEVMSCWVHRTAANMANRPGQRWKQGSVASRVTLGALVKHIPGTLEHLQPCLAFDAPGGLVPFFVAYA